MVHEECTNMDQIYDQALILWTKKSRVWTPCSPSCLLRFILHISLSLHSSPHAFLWLNQHLKTIVIPRRERPTVLYHPSSGQESLAFRQDPLHSDNDITQIYAAWSLIYGILTLIHHYYFHPTICLNLICFHPSQPPPGHILSWFPQAQPSSTCLMTLSQFVVPITVENAVEERDIEIQNDTRCHLEKLYLRHDFGLV